LNSGRIKTQPHVPKEEAATAAATRPKEIKLFILLFFFSDFYPTKQKRFGHFGF